MITTFPQSSQTSSKAPACAFLLLWSHPDSLRAEVFPVSGLQHARCSQHSPRPHDGIQYPIESHATTNSLGLDALEKRLRGKDFYANSLEVSALGSITHDGVSKVGLGGIELVRRDKGGFGLGLQVGWPSKLSQIEGRWPGSWTIHINPLLNLGCQKAGLALQEEAPFK